MHNTVSLILIICLYIQEDETLFGCAKIYPNKSANGSFFADVRATPPLMEDCAFGDDGSLLLLFCCCCCCC